MNVAVQAVIVPVCLETHEGIGVSRTVSIFINYAVLYAMFRLTLVVVIH